MRYGDRLTGKLGGAHKISVPDGAMVTLSDVTINGENSLSYLWAGLNCSGNATIILEGTNTLKGFYERYPGIRVLPDKTLTIRGDGELTASSNGKGAGIGGGWFFSCGNIVIEEGTITATGGYGAAGIGGGGYSDCGTITIKDTVTKVTATKGKDAPYSIGNGKRGECGEVTLPDLNGPSSADQYIYPPDNQ